VRDIGRRTTPRPLNFLKRKEGLDNPFHGSACLDSVFAGLVLIVFCTFWNRLVGSYRVFAVGAQGSNLGPLPCESDAFPVVCDQEVVGNGNTARDRPVRSRNRRLDALNSDPVGPADRAPERSRRPAHWRAESDGYAGQT
jgi:hypothetical protein